MIQFCSQAYFETLFYDEHILGNILFTSCIVCYTYICFRLLMLKTIWCDFIIIFLNIEIWYWVVLIVNIYVKALSSFHAFQCFCDMQQYFFLHWIWMNPHVMQDLTENHSQSCTNFVYYVHVSVFLIYLHMWTI